MGTPFAPATTAPARAPQVTDLATDAQLRRALSPMLQQYDWSKGQDSWVRRIAVIAATLTIAERVASDERTAQQLKIELIDRHDLFLTFHQLMEFSYASAVNDERDPSASKPLTKKGASALIDHLKGCPEKVTAASPAKRAENAAASGLPSADVVPAGRYAVETEPGALNRLAFYKVDRPEEGKWAGKVFVKLMVSDEERRLSWATTKSVLAKIAETGAEAASAAYGREFKHCGVCGRGLSNDDSRKRGIGPDCAAKLGW